MLTRLHPFDLTLVAFYLVGITLFGLRFRSSDKSLKNYFLADRSAPWWAIALSIVSAETSTLTIVSIPGLAFGGNFGFLQLAMGYMIGRIVLCIVFLPRYFEGQLLTAYQLIDRRFGSTLHKVTAALFLIVRAAAEGVRVFAISIVVSLAIGAGDILSIGIISTLTLVYTFEGGMAAVIWTDVVQMGLYLFGTIVAIITLGTHVDGGWTTIHAVAGAAGKFHLFDFAWSLSKTYTFWAGILGGTFLTMASHGTDQLMVQRLLAAKNLRESRLALLSSGAIIFVQFTLFLLIGAGLFVFYGQHPQTFTSADKIFPTFIVQQMPTGIAGLLVAAILAAAMSNLSAALNSLSSTTVVDFYLHLRPQATEQMRIMISRASTFMWALILFGIAVYSVFVGGKGHVVETGLSIASVAYGSLLGVFLLGTLTKYATQTGAIFGMIVGFALNLALWLQTAPVTLGNFTLPKVAYTWYVLIGAAVTFAVGSLISLITKQSKTKAITITALMALCFHSHAQTTSVNPNEARNLLLPRAPQALAQSRSSLKRPRFSPTIQTPNIAAVAAQGNFSEIDTLFTTAIAEQRLPGAVFLLGHNGHIVYHHTYGNRSIDPTTEPMTEDTIFDMASLTKCLATATAMMQLYEQGKFQLDDPIAKYLPEFAVNGKDKITIRQILTHHSGLAPDVSLKDPWGLAAPDRAAGIRLAITSTPSGPAGKKFVYSDINYIMAGLLVEHFSGQREDAYTYEHIYKPLGMTHTRYLPYDKVCGYSTKVGAAVVFRSADPAHNCTPDDWYGSLITTIAPTTHDDEGNAQTNPHFDQMTRGTVHDPTTRRMGGVAGHAGLFSTAADVALYAQALLDRLAGHPSNFPLSQASLRIMCEPEQPTGSKNLRGIGWDIDTAFSRPRGSLFPVGSFGHTGFTGTTLWMDPRSNTYYVLLANAIHPKDKASITTLRAAVATVSAKDLDLYPETSSTNGGVVKPTASVVGNSVTPQGALTAGGLPAHATGPTVTTGLDELESHHFAQLESLAKQHNNHLKLGLLTNGTGLDAHGARNIDILLTAPKEIKLTTLFSPEHGISGKEDHEGIGSSIDEKSKLPVVSLYGAKPEDRHPRHDQLKDLDAVVIDLQDAGVRFYTYETVLGYFLEAAAAEQKLGHRLEIVVLDRPALTSGVQVAGPMLDAGKESYIGYMPEPVQHGMTLGEMARFIVGEKHLEVPVTVIRMGDYQRGLWYDATGVPWVRPSPNLVSVEAAATYPGVELLQYSNVSVGRGTDTPFLNVGAEWITTDEAAKKLADTLNDRHIAGIHFEPTSFTPTAPYLPTGKLCHGVHLTVTDRSRIDAPELGIELIAALHAQFPTDFKTDRLVKINGNQATQDALMAGTDPKKIAAAWEDALFTYREARAKYLLYGFLPPM